MTEHSYKGHQISLRRDSLGRPWAVITKAKRHCLTITGRLSGSHDRAEEVKGAALDAVTKSVNGVPWSAQGFPAGPRGRLIRELEP